MAKTRSDLKSDLARLRGVLAHLEAGAMIRRALVFPNANWFPDRWTLDLESVRHLALRLLAYAGLPDLDAECTAFEGAQSHQWLPQHLRPAQRERQPAGLFLGIQDGCAYFGVSLHVLPRPEELAGVMAHEVAHAWRRSKEIELEDREEEEQVTDVTTIALGFGILSTNAAYRFEIESRQTGVLATTRWSHHSIGYLGPDRLSRLLAVQCVLRGEHIGRIGALLGTTQRAVFLDACRELDPLQLEADLGIELENADLEVHEPPIVAVRHGRAARLIHDCAVECAGELGADGGVLATPRTIEIDPIEARHVTIGSWGRPHIAGGWLRRLHLVEDPEWDASLLLLDCIDDGAGRMLVIGMVSDPVAASHGRLTAAIEPFFTGSSLELVIHGELPAFAQAHGSAPLGTDSLGRLLRDSVGRLDWEEVATDLAVIKHSIGQSLGRVQSEPGESGLEDMPPENGDMGRLVKAWWNHASRAVVIADESATLAALTTGRAL